MPYNINLLLRENLNLSTYIRDIGRYPLLTTKEERNLLERIKYHNDTKAREKLIVSHLRFVVKVARVLYNQHAKVRLVDLINQGNYGLVYAVQAYKIENVKKLKFLSYAIYHIRNKIYTYINQVLYYNKQSFKDKLIKFKKTDEKLCQILMRLPTPEEVCEAINEPVSKVNNVVTLHSCVVSTDKAINVSGCDTIGDVIIDEKSEPPDSSCRRSLVDKNIVKLLQCLTDKEKKIVTMYYGLMNGEQMTLDDVGTCLNLTRERIRQIKEVALSKLRHPKTIKGFRNLAADVFQ